MLGEENEIVLWQWLLKLVETLGVDGMSSEESDDESGMEIRFHVKRLPWRRDLTKELGLIDEVRMRQEGIFGRQGSKPVKRIRENVRRVSTRRAARSLPKALYNQEWLEAQPFPQYSPGFTETDFKWFDIIS
jgi:hypothetical protein